jgi:ATP-dependent DNA ligase
MGQLITVEELPRYAPGELLLDSSAVGKADFRLRVFRYAPSDIWVPPSDNFLIVIYREGTTSMNRRVTEDWKRDHVDRGVTTLFTRAETSTWRWDDGVAMFAGAEKLNWEGIVSKRADAPYRSDSWQKIKTSEREFFPIVGFEPALGGIAALHVGRREGKKLTYVGKVGTGFTMKVSADLRRRLDALPPPKTKLFSKRHIKAVEPTLVAHVEYRDITADGFLRHPSFKGLAEDQPIPKRSGQSCGPPDP